MLGGGPQAALNALFSARRVALVGASERPQTPGAVLWRNLADFPGEVIPVTHAGAPVGGVDSYRSLVDIPGDIDAAVVVVRAEEVVQVVRDAGRKGVPICVVISSGFSETGPEGRRRQEELLAVARASGVRIIGPNCLGVQDARAGLNASLAPGGLRPGTISMVTQSGAYGMALYTLSQDDRVAFDKVVATGNKIDISDTEMLDYLAGNGSGPICFYLESLPDGRSFVERAAGITDRPVIVCRTGVSPAGRRAAQSHTAGLAGRPRIWSAAFADAGIIETTSGLELLDAARVLDAQPAPAGPRVGVVTNSGGVGVELTDRLSREGLEVPLLSDPLRARLAAELPDYASPANPVDLTPAWRLFPQLYPYAIDLLARSGEVDSVVAVLLQRSATAVVAEAVSDAVRRLREDGNTVPVYVCWVGSRDSLNNADPLREGGVPVLEWPDRAARALGHATRYGIAGRGSAAPTPDTAPDSPADWLDPAEGAQLLSSAGLPIVRWAICGSADEAVDHARAFTGPVVLKACHPAMLHKSQAGGVALGLLGDEQVRTAADRLLGLRAGVALLLQEQGSGTEIIVGGVRDVEFGPVVMVGLGGVDVESMDDIQLALAPLDRRKALDMIGKLRAARRLSGQVDLGTIADVMMTLGDVMVQHPEIQEVDLNPVLVDLDGCTIVDWRIRVDSR